MSVLKLYSVRLESVSIDRADEVASQLSNWSRSDILRLAIWIGQKVVDARHASELHHLWWDEQFRCKYASLEDVLRTADIELENLKSSK